MPSDDDTGAWDRVADWVLSHTPVPPDSPTYGPHQRSEAELRLCGDVAGVRVLDLGCGGGHNAVAFARRGARVVGVDRSAVMLTHARALAEAAGQKVELRQSDLAELAFVATASVDLVFCSWTLQYVDDLQRVFRQVHRVLRPDGTIVVSVPHPAGHLLRDEPGGRIAVGRPYDDPEPQPRDLGGEVVEEHQHTVSALVQALRRSNLQVDVLAEPDPAALPDPAAAPRWEARWALAPSMPALRARKQGV